MNFGVIPRSADGLREARDVATLVLLGCEAIVFITCVKFTLKEEI